MTEEVKGYIEKAEHAPSPDLIVAEIVENLEPLWNNLGEFMKAWGKNRGK